MKTKFFFIINYNLQDVQVTEEAFSSQKKTSSTSKHDISKTFSTFVGHFSLLDPDPDSEYGYRSGSTDLIDPKP